MLRQMASSEILQEVLTHMQPASESLRHGATGADRPPVRAGNVVRSRDKVDVVAGAGHGLELRC